MDKSEIREAMLKRRTAIPTALTQEAGRAICAQIMATPLCRHYCYNQKRIPTIGLYAPIKGEVDFLACLPSFWERGFQTAFPKVISDEAMAFYRVTAASELRIGHFGILEPGAACLALSEPLDLVLVPGLAFDQSGGRIGYGKGYYDRFFAEATSTVLIGVGYDFQVYTDSLPQNEADRKLDLIITAGGHATCFTSM